MKSPSVHSRPVVVSLTSSHLCGSAVKDEFCEQVWGCGGTAAQECQQRQKSWEKRAVTKEQNRKVFFCHWLQMQYFRYIIHY